MRARTLSIAAAALALAAGTGASFALAARSPVTRAFTTPAVSTAQLVRTYFTSPQRGYGLFDLQAGTRCEALAARTTDGGARFGPARAITSWNCNNAVPTVTSIAADSAGDVFAFGPKLFIYRNATGKFVSAPQSGTVLAVSAVGRSVWMLLARCHGSARDSCSLHLVESADGGRTWHAARTQPLGSAGGGAVTESAVDQTWLLRTGAASGYVLASPGENSSGKPDSAALAYTRNGGRTWSRMRIPCGQDALSVVLARAPGGGLAAVCASEPTAGSQGKTTTLSANGGRSWTKPVGCVFGKPCHDTVLYGGYVSAIAAVSAKTVYLIGSRGPLLVTSDGGVRWRRVSPSIGAVNGGVAQVVFFGKSDGLVFGDNPATAATEVWHTSDGGARWSKPVVPRLS